MSTRPMECGSCGTDHHSGEPCPTRGLWKTTITIWSRYDGSTAELADLAREADEGDAYCSRARSEFIADTGSDPDWDGTDFFDDADDHDGGPTLNWTPGAFESSYFLSYYESPWGLEETIARLVTASGQPAKSCDQEKTSVEFVGQFNGHRFTLYDYKEDRAIHIGGTEALDVPGLVSALTLTLSCVPPTPYAAAEYYDAAEGHAWPVVR